MARGAIISPIHQGQAVFLRPLRAAAVASGEAPQSTSAFARASACCLIQAAAIVPVCKSIRRRRQKVATAATGSGGSSSREKGRVAAAAVRPSTEDRLKELESIVGDDDEFGSFDELDAVVEPTVPVQAANGARFASLPEELPRAIPFLAEPSYRAFAANVPGDAGFDPLGLCTDVEKFINYRESEIKHGRLAMWAALAWPLAEAAEEVIADEGSTITGLPDFLADSGGRMLPTLTGGYGDQFVETFAALTFIFGSAFELTTRRRGTEPGDVGFDPIGLKTYVASPFQASFLPKNRNWMMEAEVKHSRLAMVAVFFDFYDEFTTGNPTIEDTENILLRLDAKLAEVTFSLSGAEIPAALLADDFPTAL